MKQQQIFFDLDDTLIHCNKYFVEVLRKFADWMMERFPHLSKKTILNKQMEFDLAGVHEFGLKKERFPLSLVETFEHYALHENQQEAMDSQDRDFLLALGHEVYEQEFEAYPDMEETLSELTRQGHLLCLYTGGDTGVQRGKVKQLGLERFFADRIFITEHKNTAAFQRVLAKMGSDLSRTWMIGNSPRTDIIPALEAGVHAIFIPSELEWVYNKAEIQIQPQGVYKELRSLKEVPAVIEAYALK